VLYLVIGSVFYHYDYQKKTVTLTADGMGRTNPVFCFFEAVTIGYSVGLSNKDPSYIPVVLLCIHPSWSRPNSTESSCDWTQNGRQGIQRGI